MSGRKPMFHKVYIILTVVAACLLAGCRGNSEHWNDHGRIVEIVGIDGHVSIHCDKTTNIAYLTFRSGNKAAMTAYLNADGQPSRCNEVRR